MTEQHPIVSGTPTLRTRLRQRLGGGICRRVGHHPRLVDKTYFVTTGPAQVIGEARLLGTGQRLPLRGAPAEQRTGREVVCRRCGVTCGDSILEDGR